MFVTWRACGLSTTGGLSVAGFKVRIELQGASQGDYTLLHRRLEAAGYRKASQPVPTREDRSPSFRLPSSEYELDCVADARQVRDHARAIADSVASGGMCHVTPAPRKATNLATI